MERFSFWMNNPPDFIHLFIRQFWHILKMGYPSLVWKRPLLAPKVKSCVLRMIALLSLTFLTRLCMKLSQFASFSFSLYYNLNLSMNPELDIGQVEGAYMMGLGLWLTEKIIYDPQTGKNLTNGTWVNDIVSSHFSTFYEKPFHVVLSSVFRGRKLCFQSPHVNN